MVITPTWQAATAGYPANAGHVNQLIATHDVSYIYNGQTLRSSQTRGIDVYSDTQTQWLSQTITTAATQTAISSVDLQVSAVGGSPTLTLIGPLVVSIYADSAGLPTGSPLATVSITSSTVYSAPYWVPIPLSLFGATTSTTYHLVVNMVGTAGHYYVWQRSSQGLGAATSTNGLVWTAQSYGLMYRLYDQSAVTGTQIQYIYEDNGARITQFTYNANGTINTITEITTAQSNTGATLTQSRSITYTTGLVTGVI